MKPALCAEETDQMSTTNIMTAIKLQRHPIRLPRISKKRNFISVQHLNGPEKQNHAVCGNQQGPQPMCLENFFQVWTNRAPFILTQLRLPFAPVNGSKGVRRNLTTEIP